MASYWCVGAEFESVNMLNASHLKWDVTQLIINNSNDANAFSSIACIFDTINLICALKSHSEIWGFDWLIEYFISQKCKQYKVQSD